MKRIILVFALIGALSSAALVLGLIADLRDFDRTRGGYSPPYTGFTGEPIDWNQMDVTQTGLVSRGYVVNTHINGTTGMISFEFYKMHFDFRPLSERALVVHRPREALIERGFEPRF